MKGWPVGTLCEVISSKTCPEIIGRECTIVGALELRTGFNIAERRLETKEAYLIDIQIDGFLSPVTVILHNQLRPKRFPGQLDSWLREKMDDLLKPVDVPKYEEDLV